MKLRTIQNKTDLRKHIADSVGTTGVLQKLGVFADGTWTIFSSSTIVEDEVVFFGRIDSLFESINMDSVREFEKGITQLFKSWEEKEV